jgi:hypothetical protein
MSSVTAIAQGLTFDVIPSTFEENLPKERFATPVRLARCLQPEVLEVD